MVRQVSEARRPTVVTKSQLRESLPAIQSYGLAVLSVCVALGIGLLASSYYNTGAGVSTLGFANLPVAAAPNEITKMGRRSPS
jgi:hypothetical protein